MPWEYNERNNYFKLNGIDPYKVLDVTKDTDPKKVRNNYKKLALLLHPDKGKNDSTEFLVLKECYLYIIEDQKELVSEEHSGRDMASFMLTRNDKESIRNDNGFSINDLNDPEIRKALLPESDVNVLDIPIASSDRVEPVVENFFGRKKKFDLKYFNAVFEIEKDLNKEMVIRNHSIKPYNETNDSIYAEVAIYNGEMAIKKPKTNQIFENTKNNINIETLSKKDLKKLVDKKLANTKKIKKEAYSIPTRAPVSIKKISEKEHLQNINEKKNNELRSNRDYILNQNENIKKILLTLKNN
jgi:curved DNA-binding protein CbpA